MVFGLLTSGTLKVTAKSGGAKSGPLIGVSRGSQSSLAIREAVTHKPLRPTSLKKNREKALALSRQP
eukprot:2009520-Karenia_brevis.AAC.1